MHLGKKYLSFGLRLTIRHRGAMKSFGDYTRLRSQACDFILRLCLVSNRPPRDRIMNSNELQEILLISYLCIYHFNLFASVVGQNTQPQAPQSVPVHSQGNLVAPPQPVVTSGVQSAGVPLNPPIGLGQNMPVSQQQPIQVLGVLLF